MSEGLFTIRHFEPSTGKAHIARVCCDLCSVEMHVDTIKVDHIEAEFDRIARVHVCKKPEKKRKEPKKRKFVVRLFGEVIAEVTNRLRFRERPVEEEEDDSV